MLHINVNPWKMFASAPGATIRYDWSLLDSQGKMMKLMVCYETRFSYKRTSIWIFCWISWMMIYFHLFNVVMHIDNYLFLHPSNSKMHCQKVHNNCLIYSWPLSTKYNTMYTIFEVCLSQRVCHKRLKNLSMKFV